ncbi:MULTISPECIES: BamA/OMP85 family outer membrane protein [unclassified Tolypothrix]|uniref:BamA/OMP85 family outer membrane protein n=1 Tax=unclassified Tolypothrix TaxID=2649714 RepID=UPI0005EAB0B9|nr:MULTISPECIES: outer membrane protein assembly factor [unclassified Tolypothrix]BAY94120.1 surface antigen D15 domain-containing protein [Microchaete diplosiphon NIES-3275]EKF03826.1 putative surface antigen [Tolypothrix sp. PCC 7601]MBE9085551.1 outer membrane protein assembly factor [Tolypothrix sp. LEGE 11397]UYD27877.1 outer membrane protein assembly factor [Tolypothrix sp. PCC 7712]UYD36256.1 outer membrane protein assembly factor [Tolypothrix sp. PCC 7601]
MRVSSAAIFTLATLAASNATQQAMAAPAQNSIQTEKATKLIVPVIEDSPARVEAVSAPETVVAQQFSQNPVVVQRGVNNNSAVMVTPEQGNKKNVPVVLPTPPVIVRTPAAPVSLNQGTKGNAKVTTPNTSTPKVTPVVTPPAATPPAIDNNLVVTATDVQILGASQELQQIVRQVIKTQKGGDTSQSQLQKDVAAILNTGLFTSANVSSRTTPAGLNVVYQVQPIVVRSLQLSGAKVLTYQVALAPFQSQIGAVISPAALQQAVQQINKWYADNGYNLARVMSIKPNREGILTVNVAEGLVGDIKFRFLNDDGQSVDSKGNPVSGRTKPDFIRQQLKLKPGQIFQENTVRQDVQQLYRTGLFETVNVALEGDANKVDLVYELKETGARAVNVGGSYNADQGVLGTLTYQDQNVGGKNNTLGLNVGVGLRDFQFDTKYTSPYRETSPDTLGYTINAFRRRELSTTFDDEVPLPNGDRAREGRIGGSVSLQRPIDGWDTSLGFNYNRISIRDRQGNLTPTDAKGNALTASGTGIDDLTTVSFTATKDQRNNPLNPTQGSVLKLSTEQSIPVGQGNISMNRVTANYSQYVPLQIFSSKQPQVFAVNLQAGTVLGNLPPYESFNLGGSNSVRGYNTGDVGNGRSYVLASAEYRFPLVSAVGGVLFADFASDLGSGSSVIGDPAGVRGKPGTGFGYGAGVRFDSPLGLIRADYGINDQGESRVHFGIGQRF